MQVIFFGTPQFAVPTLQRLIEHSDITVTAVVTQPDKRRGRGSKVSASPVKRCALHHELPVYQPRRLKKDQATLAALQQSEADAFVVVAYGQLLSQGILDMPRLGCINGHGSLLPNYRGAAPIQWSLYHGEAKTGITSMLMDAGMDTGPMLLKRITPINLTDTAVDLAERLAEITADVLIETLGALEAGQVEPTPQDNEAATYAPLLSKEDFALAWSRPAMALHNQIRGFYPNCSTAFQGQPLKVLRSLPLDHPQAEVTWQPPKVVPPEPGTVIDVIKSQGPVVQTGQGPLLLLEVQPAGKRSQSGWDFVNGMRLAVGTVLV
ncbi:MAG: methionyl-tRNA formyltransferase [Cyanobacteria bacterium P01_A01_bin.135]